MFFRILRRDLKRKRIMNVILLLFIILSSMFISSSVKNLVTVSGAVNDFFENAGVQDYTAGCVSDGVTPADMRPVLKTLQNVDSFQTEEQFAIIREENLTVDGHTVEMPMTILCSSMDRRMYRYYGEDNRELTEVKPGEIWFPTVQKKLWQTEVGDEVQLSLAGVTKTFRFGGYFKDPMFNSAFVSTKRFLMNEEDFLHFYENPAIIPYTTEQANMMTSDLQALEQEFSKLDASLVNFNLPKSMLKYTYILDVLVTAILLVFSLFIVLIALTILKFSIRFSIEEDFREIGVMKAIGLPMGKTRWMYVSKYTGLGILGAGLGLLLGIPFGNLLIASSAQNMVISGGENYFLNLISAAAVALLIILFSYHCAGKMKKYTPMDAIRSGETGERYGQKGKIHLSRNKMPVPFFLALNDLLSSPRRYGVMLIAFSLSLILLTMLGTTAATLSSEKLVKLLGVQESDVYMDADVLQMEKVMSPEGEEYIRSRFSEIQETIQDAGIPCKVFAELWFRANLQNGDKTIVTGGYYGFNTDAEKYSFLEGSSPVNDHEIALTPLNAQRLGVSVGDTVLCDGEECMLTGIYDCFNNMGDSMRLSPKMDMDFESSLGLTATQITFLDNPDGETAAEYVKTIQELFPEAKVMGAEEFLVKVMGETATIVTGLKNMAVIIVLLVSVFTVVLMERSFISREKNEIALMKAVGFGNSSLCLWHSLRIALVIVLSGLISLLVSGPLTRLCIGPIFAMMGVSQIEFVTNPAENYIFYPVIMIVFTVAADWLTAQCMRRITAADTSNIE